MRLLAIADPHLSFAQPKPMDIFGWKGHPEIFFSHWREVVKDDDVVIIAGDISWALRLDDALLDLQMLAKLPGQKILLRGNHDYWWPSISKLRSHLPEKFLALQHDSLIIGKTAIIGTRGWDCPGSDNFDSNDQKLYERELKRLRLSIDSLQGKDFDRLVVTLHFPPTNGRLEKSGFTDIIEEIQPDAVIYGHLHGIGKYKTLSDWKGIPWRHVAADAVDFYPQVIFEVA